MDNAAHPAKRYKDPTTRIELKPGVYNTLTGIPKLIQTLVEARLFNRDRFERFVALNGPQFYGLKHSRRKVRYERHPWTVPRSYEIPGMNDHVVDFCADETMQVWQRWPLVIKRM